MVTKCKNFMHRSGVVTYFLNRLFLVLYFDKKFNKHLQNLQLNAILIVGGGMMKIDIITLICVAFVLLSYLICASYLKIITYKHDKTIMKLENERRRLLK